MKRSITPWTTAVAAAALFALPAAGWAQTGTTGQTGTPVTEQQTQEREQGRADEAANEHLREARAALDRIDNETLSGEAQQKVAELKRHFSALERSVGANDRASATGAAQRSERATEPRGTADWQAEVAAIDRLLAELIGPDQGTTGAVGTTGTTTATGATGTTGAAAATVTLDEPTRDALADVRKHVTKFAARMAGDDTDRRDDPHHATDTAAATGTATTDPQTTATQQATGQTDTTAAQAAQGQANTEQARRHLTEARNTLSEMTQLPQAAELSGEARTQVSQLIANFNELITTQEDWRASYAKVEANLDALLGPEPATATGTAGAVGTTGTGTAAAVGTTGAATVADLDPEVRAKLVELRAKLNEFERAASGGATTPEPMSPDATAGAQPHPTPTHPQHTTATHQQTSATQQQTTAQQDPAHGAPTGHMDQAEMMRHIEAIEAILNANDPMAQAGTAAAGTVGTTGTPQQTQAPAQPPTGAAGGMAGEAVTLSRAQVEQLRVHLNQLRALVQR
jgi:hypothetical protein